MNRIYVSLGLGLSAVIGSALLAQEPKPQTGGKPPEVTTTERTRQNPAMSANSDEILVQWLVVGNENEVEFARIAVSRAQSPEVKQFAQKMIDDHTACVQKLQRHGENGNHADRGTVGRGEPGNKKAGTEGGRTERTERTERTGEQGGQVNTGNDSRPEAASS
ncbi:MAG: DUF4142 domain-containing protein, partial [Planctomycetes bacterium]|nr:DUF4142 domain-containing protein [Planctomycetota bacterium]